MKQIETVIFDLGGVLVDWDPFNLYAKLLSRAEAADFLANVCTREWNDEQDRGRPIAEAERILCELHPGKAELIRAYYSRWEEMLGGPIHGTVEILEGLHARDVRLLALSNWSHETFPIPQPKFPFLRLWGGKVVSGFEKLKKPDPRIYQLLLRRYSVEPKRAVFIDDVAANVRAAADLGFETIEFKGPEALAESLSAYEIMARARR